MDATPQTVKDLLLLSSNHNYLAFQEEAKKALLNGIELIFET